MPGPSASDALTHGRFAPGTLLADRYRIVSRLGAGGMGEVYRADDLKIGQAVALKFLPAGFESEPARRERFMSEIRVARQVAHPNVCRLYDVGEVAPSTGSGQAQQFLTMEYVDGEDLSSLLRRIGRLPEDKALEIARQLCAGLSAIHDRGVLHRDLKPANIMLDGRGRVRVTDFGLATAVAGAPSAGSGQAAPAEVEIAGTPAYMAPEQFAGGTLTPATDLYALGLVLFELFTGERVQAGGDVLAIRSAQHTVVQTLTSSGAGAKLDPLVQRVIARCLEFDPARRPQSAVVIAAALPGGDPLAAALAAGETPSPQMVAAAGDDGGLSFKVAVPLLVTLIAGVLFVGWVEAPRSGTRRLPVPNSPEVLAAKAREVLGRLGHGAHIGDTAYQLGITSPSDYQRWLDAQGGEPVRWYERPVVRPALRTFRHRTSPVPLVPRDSTAPVSPRDPVRAVPGMTMLSLDPEGRLEAFDAVPLPWSAPVPSTEPDARVLFEVAGLDMANFAETAPEWVGDSPGDVRKAWVGPGATDTGAELRVEAAWRGGSLVFARLIAPWTPREALPQVRTRSWSQTLSDVLSATLLLGTIAAAALMARRHVHRGRADTRGAFRIAVVIGCISLLGIVLDLNRWPGATSGYGLELLAWPAFAALLAWSFYVAVEPAVRRDWPQMLIAWSRLLDGRWRDPLVGRSLLIGSALFAAAWVLTAGWQRALGDDSAIDWLEWTGRDMVVRFLGGMRFGTFLMFGLALLLVLARRTLGTERRALLALIGTVAAAIGLAIPDGMLVILLMVGGPILAATRWGLLAGATMITLMFVMRNDYLGLPPWATDVTVVTLICMLAPGLFGFYTATRGRASTAWLDE